MPHKPESWDLKANPTLTELWMVGEALTPREPGSEGPSLDGYEGKTAKSFIAYMNIHRKAREIQELDNKPWCRDGLTLRLNNQGVPQFFRVMNSNHMKISFKGETGTLESFMDKLMENES